METKAGKKTLRRVMMIVAGIVGVGYLFFFVIFPVIIMGGPTSLYYIANQDTTNHTIEITVLDSSDKTVLTQNYSMLPDASVHHSRGFGWYPTVTWTPFTWSSGNYTFIAVLDGNYTASHSTNVQITQTIFIVITKHDIPPLEIREGWV